MSLFLFLLIGFSVTNALTFLHVFLWFRTLVSGVSDKKFEHIVSRDNDDTVPYSVLKRFTLFRYEYLGRLVRCHACMGFWVGVCLSLLQGGFITEYMQCAYDLFFLWDGFLLSGSNFFIWLIARKLGAEEL